MRQATGGCRREERPKRTASPKPRCRALPSPGKRSSSHRKAVERHLLVPHLLVPHHLEFHRTTPAPTRARTTHNTSLRTLPATDPRAVTSSPTSRTPQATGASDRNHRPPNHRGAQCLPRAGPARTWGRSSRKMKALRPPASYRASPRASCRRRSMSTSTPPGEWRRSGFAGGAHRHPPPLRITTTVPSLPLTPPSPLASLAPGPWSRASRFPHRYHRPRGRPHRSLPPGSRNFPGERPNTVIALPPLPLEKVQKGGEVEMKEDEAPPPKEESKPQEEPMLRNRCVRDGEGTGAHRGHQPSPQLPLSLSQYRFVAPHGVAPGLPRRARRRGV